MTVKSLSNFFKLTSNNLGALIGFEEFDNQNQNLTKLVDNGYAGNVIVYSIIKKLSQTLADVPLIVYDNKKDEVITSGELYDLLNQPAIYQGRFLSTKEWLEIASTYLLSTGNLYQLKNDIIGFKLTQGFEILPSQLVIPKSVNSYLLQPTSYIFNDKSKKISYTSDEVVHTMYINPSSFGLKTNIGLSPLQAGIYSLTGSTDIQKALAVLVKNQGVRGILTNESDRNLDSGILKTIKQKINNTIRGIDKINSVHVSNTKMKYISMGMSATDLKLIESGVLTDRQICNLFGVDSKLFNDVASSTFNNVQEANKSMYQNAIIPNLNRFIDVFNSYITNKYNRLNRKDLIVKADLSKIDALQADKKDEAIKNKITAEGINKILASNTSTNGKINTLIYVYGMTQEQATNIVSNG